MKNKIYNFLKRIIKEEKGQTSVEYALALLLAVAFTVGTYEFFRDGIKQFYDRISPKISSPYP